MNLIISPSQQSGNSCVMGDKEENHMREIAKKVYDLLKLDNRFNLFLIPELSGNDTETLYKLVDESNRFIQANGGKGFHVSLHSDGGYNGHGASGFYYSDAGAKFGKPIFDEMCALTPWEDMSFSKRPGLYELKATNATAFLLEVSFHDKPTEAKWIHDNTAQIAAAIVKGIYKGLGLTIPGPTKELSVSEVVALMKSKNYLTDVNGWEKKLRLKEQCDPNYVLTVFRNVANDIKKGVI